MCEIVIQYKYFLLYFISVTNSNNPIEKNILIEYTRFWNIFIIEYIRFKTHLNFKLLFVI